MVHHAKSFDTITVQFYVNCKTRFGENVFISGGCPQLGNWQPHSGIMLQTNRKNYPQWNTTHPLVIQSNSLVEFKICIVKEGLVIWENLTQNHVFFAGSNSLQIYINFDSSFMQVNEKKVIEIQCRNGIDKIMNDMQSEWGSSIGHRSNYPLERFHMIQKGLNTRNFSQVSSNLISVSDNEEVEFEAKIMNYLHPGSLVKTMSKPCQYELKKCQRKNQLISQHPHIIPQRCETCNENPIKRSYGSLPKDFSGKYQNATFESKLQSCYSYPKNLNRPNSNDKFKNNCLNAETHYSQQYIALEKDTLKASQISKQTESLDGLDQLDDYVDDLFGFEDF